MVRHSFAYKACNNSSLGLLPLLFKLSLITSVQLQQRETLSDTSPLTLGSVQVLFKALSHEMSHRSFLYFLLGLKPAPKEDNCLSLSLVTRDTRVESSKNLLISDTTMVLRLCPRHRRLLSSSWKPCHDETQQGPLHCWDKVGYIFSAWSCNVLLIC